MAEALHKKMTVEEFFEWQQHQDMNYELVDGIPVLPVKSMTGATRRHDMVTVNAISTLRQALRGTPYRPSTADQSILTFRGTRRPDVSVECGTPDDRSMTATEPRVVIEVLSPSTTRYDRFHKLEEYKQLSAIQVILLVDTDNPRVTVWRRSDHGWTFREESGLGAVIDLPEIGTELPLTELFDGLVFPPPKESV